MDLQLKGKKVLVMGASKGIGKAIAIAFVQEGAEVAICSRTLSELEKTAKQIGASHFFTCDLSQTGQGQTAVKSAIKLMGGLDVLVTNTGGPKKNAFSAVSNEQWQSDFQSLWMSVVESLNAALPQMKEKNFGRILLVTSTAAKEPIPNLTTSNGFRAGLAGLIKSVSTEYAPFGITMNLLLPGYTNTDRLKDLKLSETEIKQMIPAGRLGEPQELADLAAFLGSPRAGYITGQSIAVDGGRMKSH